MIDLGRNCRNLSDSESDSEGECVVALLSAGKVF